MKIRSFLYQSALLILISASPAKAALLSGWGMETGYTANGTVTEGSAGSFSLSTIGTANSVIRADFSSLDFSFVGASITLSGSVTLTGTFASEQFRLGLYNNNGNSLGTLSGGQWSGATPSGWLGYMAEAKTDGATAPRGRNGVAPGDYYSNTNATALTSGSASLTGSNATSGGTFSFNLTLTRLSATSVGVSYTIAQTVGGDFSASANYTDTSTASMAANSYNAVGFYLQNAATGNASFQNVSVVSAVPEPKTSAIFITALILGITVMRVRKVRLQPQG